MSSDSDRIQNPGDTNVKINDDDGFVSVTVVVGEQETTKLLDVEDCVSEWATIRDRLPELSSPNQAEKDSANAEYWRGVNESLTLMFEANKLLSMFTCIKIHNAIMARLDQIRKKPEDGESSMS